MCVHVCVPTASIAETHLVPLIPGVLKDKAVLLITHQLQFAKQADRLLVLEQGHVAATGPYDVIVARDDVPYAAVLRAYQTADPSIDALLPGTVNMAAAHPGNVAAKEDAPAANVAAKGAGAGLGVQQEDKAVGTVSSATYVGYFRYGGGALGAFILIPLFVRPPTEVPRVYMCAFLSLSHTHRRALGGHSHVRLTLCLSHTHAHRR
jgi:hypothetical protein